MISDPSKSAPPKMDPIPHPKKGRNRREPPETESIIRYAEPSDLLRRIVLIHPVHTHAPSGPSGAATLQALFHHVCLAPSQVCHAVRSRGRRRTKDTVGTQQSMDDSNEDGLSLSLSPFLSSFFSPFGVVSSVLVILVTLGCLRGAIPSI